MSVPVILSLVLRGQADLASLTRRGTRAQRPVNQASGLVFPLVVS